MAKIGAPQTNRFSIGTAEVRIGPQSLANKLVQAQSIGLLDNANLEVSQSSVDLKGGFPQTIVDTAIVSQESSLTATLREYSRRNIGTMVGQAVPAAYSADVVSLVATNAAAAAVAVTVTTGEGALFTAGEIVTIYPAARPEELTIALIDSIATDVLTLNAGTPLLFDYNGATETIHIFKSQPVAVGNVTETNYFSVMMIQKDREHGRPVIGNFWKGAIGAGMTMGTNATDFASTELNIKLLEPAATEYATGGSLEHLSAIIPSHPVGMLIAGGDV